MDAGQGEQSQPLFIGHADKVVVAQRIDEVYMGARPRPGRLRFGQPPVVPRYFGGRDELLDELGQTSTGTTVLTAVRGIGGVGKTQIAAAYFRSHLAQGSPYDVAAWLDGTSGLEAQLVALAVQLGLDEDPDPEVTVEGLLSWLASTEQRWLLVVDDVAQPSGLGGLLKVGGNGRLVLTSRYVDWDKYATLVPVDVFSPEAGAALLQTVGERPNDPGAEPLAARLGGLALALVLAGTFCRERSLSFEAYAKRLDDHGIAFLDEANDDTYAKAATAIWQGSLDAAAARCASAPLLLHVLSWLDWRSVSRVWLAQGLAGQEPFSTEGAIEDALAALRSFALVGLDDERIEILHGIIAEGAAGPIGGFDQVRSRLVAGLLSRSLPAKPGPERATVEAANEALRHTYQLVTDRAQLPGDFVRTLFTATLQLLHQRDHARSLVVGQAAAQLSSLVFGPDHPETLISRGNVAACYWLAGRTDEAIAIEEQGVADAERLFGPEDPRTLTARNNLASSYWLAGRTAAAIAIGEQLVADRERVLGTDHPETLAARANLATSYHQAGRTVDAAAIQEKLVADRDRVLGPEHPDTLAARGNLAMFYLEVRTADAIAIGEQLVTDSERILGPEHSSTLTARGNLATSYWKIGRTVESIAIGEQVVADRARLLGPNHADTLTARANLASYYGQAGRTAEAIALGEQVVADFEAVVGPKHPRTLTARANLASYYGQAGRTADAIALGEQVVRDRERLVGPEHPDTLTARANLAAYYRQAALVADANGSEFVGNPEP